MSVELDPRVLELIVSRICHDLVSPVGAISNGVELMEELGVEGRSLRYAGRLRYRYPTASVVFQVYRCAISGRPRPLASEMLRWVRADRLTRYRFPPANRRLIVRLSITFASRKLSLNV